MSTDGEQQQVTRAAGVVGAATLASRMGGFVRDLVIAYMFGTGPAADAFFVAFRIPNLLRRLFAEGTLTIAFIPVFTELLRKKGKEEAMLLARSTYTLLALVILVICAAGIIFAPALIRVMAPGFSEGQGTFALTVTLTRWCFPYIFFISLMGLAAGVLNSLGHFFAPAAAPLLLNLSLIGAALVLSDRVDPPVLSLALGALLGGLLQLLMQLPYLKRYRVSIAPAFRWRHPALKRMIRLMGPAAFGAAVYQLTVFINTVLASLLASGSVSYLYYADRLIEFPLGVFAIAVGTAVLPSLSRHAADGDLEGLKETMGHAMRLTLFINLPAMVGVMVLALPLVELLFMRGRFDQASAVATAGAVTAYGAGLWAFAGIRAVVAAFYALKDTRTPVVVAALALVLNVALSLVLMRIWQHVGLALATSITGAANMLGLLWLLRRRVGPLGLRRVVTGVVKSLAASAVMALVCAALAYLPDWGARDSLHSLYTRPLAAVALGAVVYLALAKVLKISELGDLAGMFKRR